jgi:hypothetical protein
MKMSCHQVPLHFCHITALTRVAKRLCLPLQQRGQSVIFVARRIAIYRAISTREENIVIK